MANAGQRANSRSPKRCSLQSTPLIPPAKVLPGVYWAAQKPGSGPSNLRRLKQELEELREPRYGATQVAIELLDEGERTPWNGAGDMPEFWRDPWSAVIWIGRPDDALNIIMQLLKDPLIGSVLCRGGEIRISRRGQTDSEAHVAEVKLIKDRLVVDPLEKSLPITTQAVLQATRLAYPQIPAAPPESGNGMAAETGSPPLQGWPPNQDWNIRNAEYAYMGRRHQIKGTHARLLKLFIEKDGAVNEETLRSVVWHDSNPENSTILSTLCHLRAQLRSDLTLPKDFDPLPNQDRGERHRCWKLDREGIRSQLSRL